MTLGRTYLFCSLLGLSLLSACTDTAEQPIDSGVFPALPGGGTTGGGGVTGGSPGGITGGSPGGISGTQGGISGTQGGISGTQGGISGTQGGISGTQGGISGTQGGTGGTAGTGGTGGTTGATGGTTGGTGGTPGGAAGGGGTCPGLPAVTDYSAKGPFGDVMVQPGVSAAGGETCTLFRPGASLGKDGFKHPIAVWGNGILTTPDLYTETLSLFASHGFVVIACDSSSPERPCLNACMDWLVQQNGTGAMAGKLDTTKEITLGYSWGGGASIDTANRPNVKATVSFHGMPPRDSADPWSVMKSPLLLFTSTGDSFVSADGFVTPNYNSSKVPTFCATLNEDVDHLYIIDPPLGASAIKERGPAVAWMRYWACGDQNAKKFFFGSDCTLCKAPFSAQKKPAASWQ